MYTNNVASWNGAKSKNFTVENGVRQGGIVSPVLFCVYFDGLLQLLRKSKVGCHIGNVFVGALAYADDLSLLASTPQAMKLLLHVCDKYGKKFSDKFNATKSAWLFVIKCKLSFVGTPQFSLYGEVVNRVSEFTHLEHIISDKLDDKPVGDVVRSLLTVGNALFSHIFLQSCSLIHETGSDNQFQRYSHSKFSKWQAAASWIWSN